MFELYTSIYFFTHKKLKFLPYYIHYQFDTIVQRHNINFPDLNETNSTRFCYPPNGYQFEDKQLYSEYQCLLSSKYLERKIVSKSIKYYLVLYRNKFRCKYTRIDNIKLLYFIIKNILKYILVEESYNRNLLTKSTDFNNRYRLKRLVFYFIFLLQFFVFEIIKFKHIFITISDYIVF